MPMSPEEFRQKMSDIYDKHHVRKNFPETEMCHIEMDELLCEALRELGYGAGVSIYENTGKWYS